MRKILFIFSAVVLAAAIALSVLAPDSFSVLIVGVMIGIISLGYVFGIYPMIMIQRGLTTGTKGIKEALTVQSDSMWITINQMIPLFRQRLLDAQFEQYKDKIEYQFDSGQTLGDIEEYINEESIAVMTWNGVVTQIPGTLTGLGLLGTFVGLISGISEVGFSSVDAALTSVEMLLAGINTAFYTSIAGVILSILFNILHKVAWNVTARQISLFNDTFHKNVVPPVEEQERYQLRKQMLLVVDRLDRIPKNPGYSIGQSTGGGQHNSRNEAILMPQIIEGMRQNEFTFVLQPKYDINTKRIIASEAYVRWNHPKLGRLSPGVFLPIVEENGYITRLDEYIWNSVCQKLRFWLDEGAVVVPVALNISKTDILALDVIKKIDGLARKHDIPPRMIDIEIARNAFTETGEIAAGVAMGFRQKGYKTILDGFDGDYVALQSLDLTVLDELKLDLRRLNIKNDSNYIKSVFDQAKNIHPSIVIEGIESMEQVSFLRKLGCSVGQGYYFSKPIEQEDFVEAITL